MTLWILGAKLTFTGLHRAPSSGPRLLVANHLSDLDALAIAAAGPVVFVTSQEVLEDPLQGLLSRLSGCVFVERRSAIALRRDIRKIEALLKDGFTVALFPEGTSSDGQQVLPFKSALFDAGIRAQAILQPVCVQYRRIGGEPVSRANRDCVFYYGTMTFMGHLRRICGAGSFELTLQYLEGRTLSMRDDRRTAAEWARHAIESVYETVNS